MLLTIQNIQKYFGAELCLRNISCVLDAQDRAGIIGENGAGKTTLIKIITGELYPDDGIVTLAHGATVGYLEQNSVLDPACTVYREMENAFRSVLDAMDEMKRLERQMAECPGDHMLLERHAQLSAVVDAADGYNMDTQIKKILNGMAFPAPDYQKSVAVLSGGEHTRLCLAKLLLQKPDLLILDEPINGLDPIGIAEVRSFIRELYDGYPITAVSRLNNLAQRYDSGCEYPEVVITNYDPGRQNRPEQLSLFSLWEEAGISGADRAEREEK